MPAQLIWGREDRIIPVAHAEALSGTLPLHILERSAICRRWKRQVKSIVWFGSSSSRSARLPPIRGSAGGRLCRPRRTAPPRWAYQIGLPRTASPASVTSVASKVSPARRTRTITASVRGPLRKLALTNRRSCRVGFKASATGPGGNRH
jgi:hypothetical protein